MSCSNTNKWIISGRIGEGGRGGGGRDEIGFDANGGKARGGRGRGGAEVRRKQKRKFSQRALELIAVTDRFYGFFPACKRKYITTRGQKIEGRKSKWDF